MYGYVSAAHNWINFDTMTMTPNTNARAQQVKSDPEKRANDLYLKYPGSTLTRVLKSHGKDGRYLVLVVDPPPPYIYFAVPS